MRRELGRRGFFGVGAASVAALAEDRFDVLDWKLDGSAELSRRALVLVPRGLAAGLRVPVLVLLHGLGETTNETAGVRAWVDRYGLLTSYARLSRSPLGSRPFDGRTIFVCPFTPNVWRLANTQGALDGFASWIGDVLLPEVRSKTPAETVAARTGVDGCSLGGFIGLEVFLRRPALFGAWGGVQAALRESAAPKWADRVSAALKTAGPRRLHIETSTRDPFQGANVAFSRALRERGIEHDLVVLPGPHDQPWLREVGTLEMLLWHDRVLRGS